MPDDELNRDWRAWSSCNAGSGKSRRTQRLATFASGECAELDELPPEKRPPGGNFGNEFGLTKTEQSLQKIYEKNRMYLEREFERFEPNALHSTMAQKTDTNRLNPCMPSPQCAAALFRRSTSWLADRWRHHSMR